ncbi:MAG: Mrp/NBP35 family ATP-binding protein [Deltaproteobacteria bacterium]|nr:Mrp/NBP35 family ATP-binding protein [Deltaproteobacteria bacterium]
MSANLSSDQRFSERVLSDILKKFKRKYIFLSGKGGVGKTTLSANVGWAKAKEGFKVGMLDSDLHCPNLGSALFLKDRVTADDDGLLVPVKATDNLLVLTLQNMLQSESEAVIWRGPRKTKAIFEFLSRTAWPELDYFIIDSPAGTGDETLAVLNAIPEVEAVAVFTGHPMSLSDVSKALDCLNKCNIKVKGLVETFSSIICPQCGRRTRLFSSQTCKALATANDLPILATVPMDPAAGLAALKLSKPLIDAAPQSPLTLAIKELSEQL